LKLEMNLLSNMHNVEKLNFFNLFYNISQNDAKKRRKLSK
jgi:hypothetical protein